MRQIPADQIEGIVGAKRHNSHHIGRAVSDEQTVYILHSQMCIDTLDNLFDCEYSKALEVGIDVARWLEDEPVLVSIWNGRLIGGIRWEPSGDETQERG